MVDYVAPHDSYINGVYSAYINECVFNQAKYIVNSFVKIYGVRTWCSFFIALN